MSLDLGSVTLRNTTLGTITVQQPNRTTLTSPDFKPKPNISLSEINDVSTAGVEDGKFLAFNSATNLYEFQTPVAVIEKVDGGQF